MPPAKPKPSEIAAEAKKTYIPWIRQYKSEHSATSYLCQAEWIGVTSPPAVGQSKHTRFAFYDRDPVDVALDWGTDSHRIPVIMPANDKRAGGDWEAGVMSPEECLCRRSNLHATLTTPGVGSSVDSNYPIPEKAGIYSPSVIVFRDGPENYEVWNDIKVLPIISVCPVKRPKLDSSGKKYSFKQEKELMKEKITAALRIAVFYGYVDLCIGSFGLGSGFRNPPEEVALMWREAFLGDSSEFHGHFRDIVFAFESPDGPPNSSSKSSSSKTSSSKHSSKSSSSSPVNLDIFRDVFRPSKIHGAFQS